MQWSHRYRCSGVTLAVKHTPRLGCGGIACVFPLSFAILAALSRRYAFCTATSTELGCGPSAEPDASEPDGSACRAAHAAAGAALAASFSG